MTTPAPTHIEHSPFEAFFIAEVVGLLKDTLTCLEDATPQLGSCFEMLDRQYTQAIHGSDAQQAAELRDLMDSVSDQKSQVLASRLKLHALLFGLGLESCRERLAHGYSTFIDPEIKPGNLSQALQIVSSPMSIQPQEDEEESPIVDYSDAVLF